MQNFQLFREILKKFRSRCRCVKKVRPQRTSFVNIAAFICWIERYLILKKDSSFFTTWQKKKRIKEQKMLQKLLSGDLKWYNKKSRKMSESIFDLAERSNEKERKIRYKKNAKKYEIFEESYSYQCVFVIFFFNIWRILKRYVCTEILKYLSCSKRNE